MTIATPPAQQIVANATTDINGNATFTFPMAPQGSVISGTVSIPAAPIIALVSAELSGTVIGNWTGSNPWGPIEANPTQTLVLTATSLKPATAYQAVWMASQWPLALAPGNFPGALLTSEIVAVQSFIENLGTQTGTSFTVNGIPSNTECLVIAQQPGALNVNCIVSVIGGTTGFQYTGKFGVNVLSIASAGCVVPFYGLLDSSALITFTYVSGAAVPTTVYASSQLLPDAIGIATPRVAQVSVPAGTHGIYSGFGPWVLDTFEWTLLPLTSATTADFGLNYTEPGSTTLLDISVQPGTPAVGLQGTVDMKGTLVPFASGAGQLLEITVPTNYDAKVTCVLRDLGLGA